MIRKGWLVLALVAAFVTPAFAGEGHGCDAPAQECLNKMAAKLAKRGWVGVELDHDKHAGTITVLNVIDGSPAEAAGLKAGDVLLALNGVGMSEENQEQLKNVKSGMAPGKEITYTIARKGKKRDVSITLGKVPEEVLARWVGGHMLEGHVTIAAAR